MGTLQGHAPSVLITDARTRELQIKLKQFEGKTLASATLAGQTVRLVFEDGTSLAMHYSEGLRETH